MCVTAPSSSRPAEAPHRIARLRRFALAGFAAALLPAVAPAARAEAPLLLELNRLEARENGACRVWFVARNRLAEAVDPLRLDLVLFGRDGVILRRVAVDVGPLPAARSAVRIFDLPEQACDGVGQMLLNDVLACGAAERAGRAACAEQLGLSSRADGVAFEK